MSDTDSSGRSDQASEPMSLQQAMSLAMQKHQAGDLDTAEVIYQRLLQSAPNEPVVVHLLGLVAAQRGQYEKAEKLYVQALDANPDFDEAHNNLANLLLQVGRLDEAVAHYQKALKLKPQSAGAHYNLAIALEGLDRSQEALAHYKTAIDLQPDFAEAHINLGNLYDRQGQLDLAVESFYAALEIHPDVAQIECNLATVFKGQGKFSEANEHYQKSLELDPNFAEAFRQLSSIREHAEYDDDVKEAEARLRSPDNTDDQAMHWAFGLGKVFEDLKDYDKSFEYYRQGNAIRRGHFDFDVDRWIDYVTRQMSEFNEALFGQRNAVGCVDESPIFVLGVPRSGTSLTEQILASHGEVFGAGEAQAWRRVLASHFDMSTYPLNIDQLDEKIFEDIGQGYVEHMRDTERDTKRSRFVTDKMTGNFIHIGMLKLALPNAKIIHCRRGARDNCWSIFKNYFASQGHHYAYDLRELGQYYNQYRRLMTHWNEVLPNFIHEVKYEDLVDDQEGQTRALLEFCGLEWDDACLNFHQTDRAVKTASAAQVRQPVYEDSINAWRHYETHLEPLFSALERH